jgi:hypothetical protein
MPLEPAAEGLPVELGHVPVLVDAQQRLHERAVHGQLVHPVRQRRAQPPEPADEVGAAQEAVLQTHAGLTRLRRARPQHQPGKVDFPAVRRRVRTVVEAELALIAEIDDFLDVRRRQLVHVAVDRLDVHPVEQHLERRTQRQAPPAATADVVHTPHLPVNRPEIPKLRLPKIQTRHALRLDSPGTILVRI